MLELVPIIFLAPGTYLCRIRRPGAQAHRPSQEMPSLVKDRSTVPASEGKFLWHRAGDKNPSGMLTGYLLCSQALCRSFWQVNPPPPQAIYVPSGFEELLTNITWNQDVTFQSCQPVREEKTLGRISVPEVELSLSLHNYSKCWVQNCSQS